MGEGGCLLMGSVGFQPSSAALVGPALHSALGVEGWRSCGKWGHVALFLYRIGNWVLRSWRVSVSHCCWEVEGDPR